MGQLVAEAEGLRAALESQRTEAAATMDDALGLTEIAGVDHGLSPRSRVSSTSTVKRRITPSTIPAGKNEKKRIAAYM